MAYVVLLSEIAERYDMLRLVGSLLCWRLFAESRKGHAAEDTMALWAQVCSGNTVFTPNTDEAEIQVTLATGVRDLCETGEEVDEYLDELNDSWEQLKREAAEVCSLRLPAHHSHLPCNACSGRRTVGFISRTGQTPDPPAVEQVAGGD